MVDETELIQAAQHGDREAFDELVRRTYVDLFTLAVRLTGNEEDARDVVQDAYLRAWKGIGKFRGDAALSTWLYRITANCASTHLSRRRRTRTEPLLPGFEPADARHEAQPEAMAETSLDLARIAVRGRRAPAEAPGGRGAPRRVRPAPRGDRRGAGHLAVGREGPAPPGPEASPGRGVRGEEVVSCGMTMSPI